MRSRLPILSISIFAMCFALSPAIAESDGVAATIVGENYCLHCSLVMDETSDAACGPETRSYALKVKSAKDKDGIAIEGLEGVTVHYIAGETSAKLTKDGKLFGKEVTISGTFFPEERAVHVERAEKYDSLADELDDWEFEPEKNRASARR